MSSDLVLITKAVNYAAAKHRGQSRKDEESTPYINHPISVANLLANEGGITDIYVIATALLHDTIEDTDATAEEIEALFGATIKDFVLEVSDDKSLPSPERKRLQIAHTSSCSYEARLVKLADKICNLQDMLASPPIKWTIQRKQEYFDWAREVVNQLRGTHAELEVMFDKIYERRP
jgi:guanosine-3',5'-bis(diphosphate) 3'-pyrophosphohydrolase